MSAISISRREAALKQLTEKDTGPIVDALERILCEHSEPYRTIAEAIALSSDSTPTLDWLQAAIKQDIDSNGVDDQLAGI